MATLLNTFASTIEVYWNENCPFNGKDTPSNRTAYLELVMEHLEDINKKQVGKNFFEAICCSKYRIFITYGGPNGVNVSCPAGGWVALLKAYIEHNNMWPELTNALGKGNYDTNWLIEKLATVQLPTWQNSNKDPSWWQADTHWRRQHINALLEAWQSGRQRPSNEQFDIIILMLNRYLTPGPGSSASIRYDPLKDHVNGRPRPPQIGLFHELVHAYYTTKGLQLSIEASDSELTGRYFEIMSVGLRPFDNARFSENALRRQWGLEERLSYQT